jgi:transcriptional regulator with XRE-family HTH domain
MYVRGLLAGLLSDEEADPQPGCRQLFAQRLDHLKRCHRLSNGAVARAGGISTTYVQKLLDGKSSVSLEVASRIARHFGVSLDYFADPPLHAVARVLDVDVRYLRSAADPVAQQTEGVLEMRESCSRRLEERTASLTASSPTAAEARLSA